MKLIPTENTNWKTPQGYEEIKLNSGLTLMLDHHLDCGGVKTHAEFSDIIREHSSRVYEHGFEWCIGAGAIAFELFGSGICKKISGNDYYDVAVDSCRDTAKRNNLEKIFKGYVSSTISGIKTNDKWDLVVGNPPHVWTFEELDVSHVPEHMQGNNLRCLVDHGMETHREFFLNIREKITDDADLFISEADSGRKTTKIILEMAAQGRLRHVKTVPFMRLFPSAVIHIFKPI